MVVSQGILTVRGGMTSHAAVVARGMGTCCVSGCGDINVDYDKKQFTLAGKTYREGDWISLDGSDRLHLRRGHPHHRCDHFRRLWPLYGLGRQRSPSEGLYQRR